MENTVVQIMKTILFASVLFVWVIRYSNIVEEFKRYGYPAWLRDLVGILKISFVIMVMSDNGVLVQVGASGIILLMTAALITHLKVKNRAPLMLPAFSLLCLSMLIIIFSRQIQ